ncbi:hypothetical protein TrRE_jg7418 [Triparma retinervis]|uniref:Uncharacterized protein n=1 Tax=Triparma retinervis TaxID=2557542 RepID=A0A9W7A5H2_9STRA|nr:hypothetical protein TrRE_jg7418 [Triparma retinervis]
MTGSIPQFTVAFSYLILMDNDFSGPVNEKLREICKTSIDEDGFFTTSPCEFHGNPKLRCEEDEFSLTDTGDGCIPCPNCKKDGTCDNGYDETLSGLCDVCNLNSFENQGECLECPANPFISNILPFAFFFIVVPALKKLLDELHDRGYITLPSLKLDITNVVRVKQLGAVLQVIGVFAALSINLSSWFDSLAVYTEFFAFPLQLSPICTGWYESLGNSKYYWVRGWGAFALIYALSMLFQNAHRIPALRSRLKRERFIEMQKIAAILILQATLICIPLSIDAGITFRGLKTWEETRENDVEDCMNDEALMARFNVGSYSGNDDSIYGPYENGYYANDDSYMDPHADPYNESNDDPYYDLYNDDDPYGHAYGPYENGYYVDDDSRLLNQYSGNDEGPYENGYYADDDGYMGSDENGYYADDDGYMDPHEAYCDEKIYSGWVKLFPPEAYLQFVSPIFLGLAIHYIIHRASVKYKALYNQEVQNMKGVASVDDVEETEDDLKKCTAFYASFCQQYVPKEFTHEERNSLRKLLWILAEAVLRYTELESFDRSVNLKWLLSSMTGLRACIFVAINLHYLWHLLKRPYVSHPHSKRIGDPLNDAEIFTTRALNWAAAWVALQAVADGSTPTEHISEDSPWLIDLLCALVVAGLLFSQRPLFVGATDEVLEQVRATISEAKSIIKHGISGMSEDGEKVVSEQRQHEEAFEGSVYNRANGSIKEMLEADSYKVVIWHQAHLELEDLTEREQARWKVEVKESRIRKAFKNLRQWQSFLAQTLLVLLGSILIAAISGGWFIFLTFVVYSSTTHDWVWWLFMIAPFLMCVVTEIMIMREKKKTKRGIASATVQPLIDSPKGTLRLPDAAPAVNGVQDSEREALDRMQPEGQPRRSGLGQEGD